MFTKISKVEQGQADLSVKKQPVAPSILSSDLIVAGDLNCAGEIQIDGTMTGEIKADTIVLGTTANVTGDIVANNVRIHGKLVGQITAKAVSLGKTAEVIGDIIHETLSIKDGASLEGHCRRSKSVNESVETKITNSNPISVLVKGTKDNKNNN